MWYFRYFLIYFAHTRVDVEAYVFLGSVRHRHEKNVIMLNDEGYVDDVGRWMWINLEAVCQIIIDGRCRRYYGYVRMGFRGMRLEDV